MKSTLKKNVTIKATGEVIPAGTTAQIAFETVGSHTRMNVLFPDGRSFKFGNFSLFFKAPSNSTLEKWCDDGVAKTVTGHKVEPDGYGPDGSPSWLLAMGLI